MHLLQVYQESFIPPSEMIPLKNEALSPSLSSLRKILVRTGSEDTLCTPVYCLSLGLPAPISMELLMISGGFGAGFQP